MLVKLMVAGLVGAAVLLAAPVWALAGTISFDFSNCSLITTPLGGGGTCPGDTEDSTLHYTNGGLSIDATGTQISNSTRTDLFVKQGGGGETGLGIAADPSGNGEITSAYIVNLSTANLIANGITGGQLSFQSVQPGEGFKVCTGNTLGSLGTDNCQTGTTDTTINLNWGSDTFIGITGTSGNVLVASELVVRKVPEPAAMELFATGLVGLAMFRRRSRS
ncbi:MAG TPA: PEP-CTERM sorting domain-containing protein [bacterium]|nr:PEP-CTERM sorting domain-containing protein [bacterium]